ncbi:MAG TPA: LicD family protein [Spirochaetota bacterium]|nr:LicD family protein [Spirochaetota bacterium]
MQTDKKKQVDIVNQAIDTIKYGQTKISAPWWTLVHNIKTPDNYITIRDLWINYGTKVQNSASVMRAISRAAVICGYHEDSRFMLKKSINRSFNAKRKKKFRKKIRYTVKKIINPFYSFSTKASAALKDLKAACDSIDVRMFLISGTLLGYLRDNKIIGWDKDIDVGFFTEEMSPDKLKAFFADHPDFKVAPVDITSDRIRINHKSGVAIDVFPHYMQDGRRWHNGTATRWWNTDFNLKTISFLKTDFYVPEDPDLYLTENYANWQVPDPNFDARIDAPNAQVTDQDCLETLFYFGLLDSINKNKPVMIRRYCDILTELGEGAWVDNIKKNY